MKKKLLALLLALVMVVGLLPTVALADDSVLYITLPVELLGNDIVLGDDPRDLNESGYIINNATLSDYSSNAVSEFGYVEGGENLYLWATQMNSTSGGTEYPDEDGNMWTTVDGPYAAGKTYGKEVFVHSSVLTKKPDKFCVNGVTYNTQECYGWYYCILNLGTLSADGELSGGDFDETDKTPHTHGGVDFVAWTDALAAAQNGSGKTAANSLPKNEGSYYLTKDVTLGSAWEVPTGTVNLCLNGKVVNLNGKYIKVSDASTVLGIHDCDTTTVHKFKVNGATAPWTLDETNGTKTVTGGVITGGKGFFHKVNENGGGAVYVDSGTLNLYGGTLAGNQSDPTSDFCRGGAVFVTGSNYGSTGKLNMYGGTITGNCAGIGSGVVIWNGSSMTMTGGVITENTENTAKSYSGYNGVFVAGYGKITLGGTARILNNTDANGKQRNLSLMYSSEGNTYNAEIAISSTFAPVEGAFKVCAYLYKDVTGTFTTKSAKSGDEKFFVSDNGHKVSFVSSNNTLIFGERPEGSAWYVDENGEEVTLAAGEFTAVAGTSSAVTWDGTKPLYVSGGKVTISNAVTLSADTVLILADGAELEITGGITGGKALTVYGQSLGSGKLTVNNSMTGNLIVCGGTATVSGETGVTGSVTVKGDGLAVIHGTSAAVSEGTTVNATVQTSTDGVTYTDWNEETALNTYKYLRLTKRLILTTTAKELVIPVTAQLSADSIDPDIDIDCTFTLAQVNKVIDGETITGENPMPAGEGNKLTLTLPSATSVTTPVAGQFTIPLNKNECGTYYYTVKQDASTRHGHTIDTGTWTVTAEIGATTAVVTKVEYQNDVSEVNDPDNFITMKTAETTASIVNAAGVTTLTLGGGKIVAEEAGLSGSNVAVLKTKFAVDFTKDFEINGEITAAGAADGSFIGFVPGDGMPEPDKVEGGSYLAVYDVPEFKNSILFEFDTWGNPYDDYVVGDGEFDLDDLGLHFALMTINNNGKGAIVGDNYQVIANNQFSENFNKSLPYTISLDTKGTPSTADDVLTFNVDNGRYNWSYTDPTGHFGQNTAYFFLGGSLRYNKPTWFSYPDGRKVGDDAPKTEISFQNFEYTWKTSSIIFTNTYNCPHENWTYTKDGNTITAVCNSETNCPYASSSTNKPTLTLEAPTNGGTPTLKPNQAWTDSGLDVPKLKYKASGETTESETTPDLSGDYTSTVTVGDKTLSQDFTIPQSFKYSADGGTTWKTYGNMEAGMAAALAENSTSQNPVKIQLLSDWNDCSVTIPAGTYVELDLNGHVMKGTGSGSVIKDYGNLTIKDSGSTEHYFTYSKYNAWTLISEPSDAQKTAAVTLDGITDSTTVVKLTGGVITGGNADGDGGGIIVSGKLNLTDGNIVGNKASYGGGVEFGSGASTMTGGVICGNYASQGGGVQVDDGTLQISGGNVKNNYASYGGGILVNVSGKLTMTGGTVNGNNAGTGGGVYFGGSVGNTAITLGGTAQITGNKSGNKESNLYLPDNHFITLGTGANAPTTMRVGVNTNTAPTTEAFVAISGESDDNYHANFFADHGAPEITLYDNTDKKIYLAIPSITVTSDGTMVYGTAATAYTVTASGFAADPTLTIEWKSGSEWNGTAPTGVTFAENNVNISAATPAGSYVFRVTNGESGSELVTSAETTLAVGKATITPAVSITGWTYGETANAPSVTGNTENGTVTYSYKLKSAEVSAYAAAVPTDAGEYTVKADVAETANYAAGSATADFTIAQKEITITPSADQKKTYGEDDPASFTYTHTALCGEDTISGALARTAGENYNADGYAFKLDELSVSSNYTLKLADNAPKFMIEKKTVTVTKVEVEDKIYDGKTDGMVISGVTFDGLVNADDLGLDNVIGTYADANTSSSRSIALSGDWTLTGGKADNYVLAEDGHVTTAVGRIVKAAQTETPAALTVEDGVVTVNEADREKKLEYSIDNQTDWVNVPALDKDGTFTVSGLTAGNHTVYVREKASGNYNASASVSADLTLEQFSVAYNANGGTGSIASQTATAPGKITVANGSAMKRTGYTFNGWNTKADGSGTPYEAGSEINTGATLYAQWTANTYTVKFNANGGKETMAEQTFTYDIAQALTANAFTREDYSFVGWATNSSGPVLYSNAQSVKNLAGSGTVTLYAIWAKNVHELTVNVTSPQAGSVKITLQQGNAVYALDNSVPMSSGTENYTGNRVFGSVPAGTYNVVVEQAGVTMTQLVVLTEDGSVDVELPTAGVNSVLEVKSDKIPTVVGGLDGEAEANRLTGTEITVTMTVEVKMEQQLAATASVTDKATQDAISEIKEAAPGKTLEFMSIEIEKTMTDGSGTTTEVITDTEKVLELIFSFDVNGKRNIQVYRQHGDEVEPFTKLNDRPTANYVDGTFYVDTENSLIYVYAQKFSTYAIGYEEESFGDVSTYAVTRANTENGKVTINTKYACEGQTVTVTVTPDEGYVLDTLTIKDKNGKELELTKLSDTKYTFKMPDGKVSVSATFKEVKTVCPQDASCVYAKFTDADTKEWYHDGVHFCVENGIMKGVSDVLFAPDGTTTRAMIVTMLWRMEGEPVVNYAMSFADVPADEWYAEAIRWAQSNKIVEGYSAEAFGPDDPITREQMATILYRYAKFHEIDVASGSTLAGYTDTDKVSSWALDAVKWANAVELMKGRTTTTLVPDADITRAEAATMIQRYCKAFQK